MEGKGREKERERGVDVDTERGSYMAPGGSVFSVDSLVNTMKFKI